MLRISFIGTHDFILERGIKGSSHELDRLITFHNNIKPSQLLFTDNINILHKILVFDTNLLVLNDCDAARTDRFEKIIAFAYEYNIPVVLLTNDLFYFELITKTSTTNYLSGIVSTISMIDLENQYKAYYKLKYISALHEPFVNTNQFTDHCKMKKYDILIFGQMDVYHECEKMPINEIDEQYLNKVRYLNKIPEEYVNFYPLRKRLRDLILQNKDKYNVYHIPTPIKSCWNCDIKGKELSKLISSSYLCLSTKSRTDRCMQKYFEILASGTVILGDIPTDYYNDIRNYVVNVDMLMTDNEILEIIDNALQNKRNLERLGREAARFIKRWCGNPKYVVQNMKSICENVYEHYSENNVIISNTCAHLNAYKNRMYNHPFIGSLFVNDLEYIDFVKNFENYLDVTPIFTIPSSTSDWSKDGNFYYKHPHIKTPYPVMMLDNIEIHWIHEKSEKECLQKYLRRLECYKRHRRKPIFWLSCSELLNNHENIKEDIIKPFIKIKGTLYLTNKSEHCLLGPNVIFYRDWECCKNNRNDSFIYEFNDQDIIYSQLSHKP